MASYTIIGGDNKEYGPISAEDIRQWIIEGRLNSQTPIKSDSDTVWRTVGTLPEFADLLKTNAPATIAPLTSSAAENDPNWQAAVESRQPDLRLGECLGAGFSFLTSNMGFVIGAVLLTWVMNVITTSLAVFIPILGPLAYQSLNGVIMGGFYLAYLRRMRGENVGPGEVFSGFRVAFGQLLLVGLVSSLLAGLAFCCLVIPCIYLGVAWVFAIALVADKRMFFWSAMELSRKVVTKVWFEVFALLIITFLPMLIFQVINGFISANYFLGLYHAANDNWQQLAQNMQGQTDEIRKLTLKSTSLGQIALLLNMFYFGGVLMRAYENLFGPRKH